MPRKGNLRALPGAADSVPGHPESAFGSSYNEMTQTNSAIIVAIKPLMGYAELCISMHSATSSIRHDRASRAAPIIRICVRRGVAVTLRPPRIAKPLAQSPF